METELISAPENIDAARRSLDPAECALIVIDIQEKLLPPLFERDVVCSMLKRLPGHRNTVLLCGMESHICVAQTALAALREGYLVHVASDAVGSRTEWNWKIGLERMRAAGAVS